MTNLNLEDIYHPADFHQINVEQSLSVHLWVYLINFAFNEEPLRAKIFIIFNDVQL